MRSLKQQGVFILFLLIAQVIAQTSTQAYYETDNCECECDCNVPDNGGSTKPDTGGSTKPDTGGSTKPDTGGSTKPDTGGSTKPDTGGSTVTGKSRDFKAWFAKMKPDAWGNYGLKVILSGINGNIPQSNINKWLDDLSTAAQKFPKFCNSGNEAADKREFAAFMTISGAETSFIGGYPCTAEIGCPNCQACSYNTKGLECQTDINKQYNGRGPLQISWNYNYEAFSKYYFGDDRLLKNPNRLVEDEATCWGSAMWFWMSEQGYGGWCMPQAAWSSRDNCAKNCPDGPTKCNISECNSTHWIPTGRKSPHDAILGDGGMGQVINIINGGYDCCPSTTYFSMQGHTLHRIQWYAEILQKWGEPLPWKTLNPVPIQDCPAAQNAIDCSRLTSDTCYWNCCNKK